MCQTTTRPLSPRTIPGIAQQRAIDADLETTLRKHDALRAVNAYEDALLAEERALRHASRRAIDDAAQRVFEEKLGEVRRDLATVRAAQAALRLTVRT